MGMREGAKDTLYRAHLVSTPSVRASPVFSTRNIEVAGAVAGRDEAVFVDDDLQGGIRGAENCAGRDFSELAERGGELPDPILSLALLSLISCLSKGLCGSAKTVSGSSRMSPRTVE